MLLAMGSPSLPREPPQGLLAQARAPPHASARTCRAHGLDFPMPKRQQLRGVLFLPRPAWPLSPPRGSIGERRGQPVALGHQVNEGTQESEQRRMNARREGRARHTVLGCFLRDSSNKHFCGCPDPQEARMGDTGRPQGTPCCSKQTPVAPGTAGRCPPGRTSPRLIPLPWLIISIPAQKRHWEKQGPVYPGENGIWFT